MKLFGVMNYYESCTYIINDFKIFSGVELLNVSLSGKRLNYEPLTVGLFSLNVFAARHFAMDFLRQKFLLLIFFM